MNIDLKLQLQKGLVFIAFSLFLIFTFHTIIGDPSFVLKDAGLKYFVLYFIAVSLGMYVAAALALITANGKLLLSNAPELLKSPAFKIAVCFLIALLAEVLLKIIDDKYSLGASSEPSFHFLIKALAFMGAYLIYESIIRQKSYDTTIVDQMPVARFRDEPDSKSDEPVKNKISKRDRDHIVAHECGHALGYAALHGLPPGIKMEVGPSDDFVGSQGFISRLQSGHILWEKGYVEWNMIVLLAGKYGEEHSFGTSCLGSANDFDEWKQYASGYLNNFYGGVHHVNPKTSLEIQSNERRFNDLRASQMELVRSLFDLNAGVYEEMKAHLDRTGRMDRDDLWGYLVRVALPEGFPAPMPEYTGDKPTSADAWPADCGYYVHSEQEEKP